MKKIYLLTTGLCLFVAVTFIPAAAEAQSPGGVSTGLALWLRADAAGTLSSTDSLNSWTYFNNGANSFTSLATNRPIVQNSTFNFLPSVFFNGAQEMDGPTGASAPIVLNSSAYAMFAVWSSTTGSGTQRMWSQKSAGTNDGAGAAVWLQTSQYGDQTELNPFTQNLGLLYSPNQPYISEINLLHANTNDCEQVDQTNISGSSSITSTDPVGNAALTNRRISNVVNRLGCRDVPTQEPFIGNLAELIIFDSSVNNATPGLNARSKIFSYLAMKYGVHLGISLLSSAGTTVWDASANATYNHDVFGLAQDNTSQLSVATSNSSTTGGGSGTGQSGAGNITLFALGSLADQSFLMLGHDNNSLTETTFDLPTTASGSTRLGRNWWIQNTGSVSGANVDFDFTGITTTGTIGTTSDFRLMVNSAGDPTFFSGTTTFYTPTGFTGNVAHFASVVLPTGNVMAVISKASGTTPLPVNFITFTAQTSGSNIDLNWTVGDNSQAASYEVDRSSDGLSYTKIGVVPNAVDQTSYSYVDQNPGSGTHFYRVLETDQDGKSIYSKVVSASIGAGEFSVAVLNNPAKGNTDAQLQINAVSAGTAFIELWTVTGKRMSLQQEAVGTGVTTVAVPMGSLPAGSYVVKVMVGGNMHVAQVVKL